MFKAKKNQKILMTINDVPYTLLSRKLTIDKFNRFICDYLDIEYEPEKIVIKDEHMNEPILPLCMSDGNVVYLNIEIGICHLLVELQGFHVLTNKQVK